MGPMSMNRADDNANMVQRTYTWFAFLFKFDDSLRLSLRESKDGSHNANESLHDTKNKEPNHIASNRTHGLMNRDVNRR